MEQPVRVSPGDDGSLEVALFGEIDFSNAAAAVATIDNAISRARPGQVTVDITAVTFLDSSGIGVLVTAYRAATALDAGYRVLGANRFVYEQLRMTGLVELFGIDPPSVPAA